MLRIFAVCWPLVVCSSVGACASPATPSKPPVFGSVTMAANPAKRLPPLSAFIVVDQFGYQPVSEKVAVIRDPHQGFDADATFTPGRRYALIDPISRDEVFSAKPMLHAEGEVDQASGDRTWWFDFSRIEKPGQYYVLDVENNVRSPAFRIADDVYREVLIQALRTFFYQRAGFPKAAKYAGNGWTDGPSHVGPLQDKNARLYNKKDDASTERDLHGGWYNGSDYSKYTNFHANYVIEMLRAYEQNPQAFSDATNIPESGNGVPDILDEAKFGMDFLIRLQEKSGAMLSLVALASGSPPSSATGQSLYGSPNTSATLTGASAFAYGSKVFGLVDGFEKYAGDLLSRAKRAYAWAEANPAVVFQNNDEQAGTKGLGTLQQEADDYLLLTKKLQAAIYLFEATKDKRYKQVVDDNYKKIHLIEWDFAFPFDAIPEEALLYYATLRDATPEVSRHIKQVYRQSMSRSNNMGALKAEIDPYRAYISDYLWASNYIKTLKGLMFLNLADYYTGVDKPTLEQAAERYLHYLHGVNPLGIVYLSNMKPYGAENSINQFYHSWFTDGSNQWDCVGQSKYGPPPGFLVGGPNRKYDWNECCPRNCGSPENDARCGPSAPVPPKGQPPMKSYKDFNTGWPLNAKSVNDYSNGYQIMYIRLLSHFVH